MRTPCLDPHRPLLRCHAQVLRFFAGLFFFGALFAWAGRTSFFAAGVFFAAGFFAATAFFLGAGLALADDFAGFTEEPSAAALARLAGAAAAFRAGLRLTRLTG